MEVILVIIGLYIVAGLINLITKWINDIKETNLYKKKLHSLEHQLSNFDIASHIMSILYIDEKYERSHNETLQGYQVECGENIETVLAKCISEHNIGKVMRRRKRRSISPSQYRY